MNSKKDKKEISKGKETYLLKIYRRSCNPEESMVGAIEEISGRRNGVFKRPEELLRWLEKQRSNDNQ
ncbi:MAG TPA: hypothetical protein ENG83_06260 [Nitrospirae bacterium]|nr:hypothetical protein [Nitrospirota bacterium]HDL20813.1 hypothetical protein [Nitrospirota bacterium]HDZ01469.1 hypothetical protein [Nitrospirota bacterium]